VQLEAVLLASPSQSAWGCLGNIPNDTSDSRCSTSACRKSLLSWSQWMGVAYYGSCAYTSREKCLTLESNSTLKRRYCTTAMVLTASLRHPRSESPSLSLPSPLSLARKLCSVLCRGRRGRTPFCVHQNLFWQLEIPNAMGRSKEGKGLQEEEQSCIKRASVGSSVIVKRFFIWNILLSNTSDASCEQEKMVHQKKTACWVAADEREGAAGRPVPWPGGVAEPPRNSGRVVLARCA